MGNLVVLQQELFGPEMMFFQKSSFFQFAAMKCEKTYCQELILHVLYVLERVVRFVRFEYCQYYIGVCYFF